MFFKEFPGFMQMPCLVTGHITLLCSPTLGVGESLQHKAAEREVRASPGWQAGQTAVTNLVLNV